MDAIIKYEVDACGGKGFLTMKWKPLLHCVVIAKFSCYHGNVYYTAKSVAKFSCCHGNLYYTPLP